MERVVPEEVEVAIKVDTDGKVLTRNRALRVAVLAPEVAVGLIEANTVRVGERNEDDTGPQSLLYLGVGVRLVAIGKTLAVLISPQ